MIFGFITRCVILAYAFLQTQITISNELLDIIRSFIIGSLNDIVTICYFLPVLILSSTLVKHFTLNPAFHKILYFFGCFLLFCISNFILIAEITFWDEYGTRFNFIAVDYLIYTQEIIGTIKESMPWRTILFSVVVIALCITYWCRNIILKLSAIKTKKAFIPFLLTLALSSSLYLFYSPSILALSHNRYINEVAMNGIYEFFAAYNSNYLEYNRLYSTTDKTQAFTNTKNLITQENQFFVDEQTLLRHTKNNPVFEKGKEPNVIFIVVESLSAEYLTAFGNKDRITPYLDEIIKDSLLFKNFYATGTRTVRGLEALTLSIPPTPGSSIIRRRNIDGLFNLSTVFQQHGYESSFIFGGYSYFDNLYNFFSQNEYQIIDRGDLKNEEISFSNIWGVADEDIFNKSFEIFDESYQQKKKFVSILLTTSNHRPYNFPEGRIDLPASGQGRLAAVKYTDYAIGKFIEKAKAKPWFDNTIFVIVADHCASSAGKKNLPVNKYHIPLIIYSPSLVKSGINNSLSSQIDIVPTILGLMGLSYETKFFGSDIINYPKNRAFIGTYQLLGYYKDDHLVILTPKKDPELFRIANDEQVKVTKNFTEREKNLIIEAISLYQSAYFMTSENKMKK